jgi:DinB superfamily
MNEQERELAVHHLAVSRERVLGLVQGLSPEQWAFHPAEGRWSIGDCVEHVTRVENRVMGFIGEKVQGPPPAEVPSSVREKDPALMQVVPDRTERRQAPEMARPEGKCTDGGQLLAEFLKIRTTSAQFAAETRASLRSYTQHHGAFGELDCYQWLLLMGLHTERHARQIEEIKADAGFPKTVGFTTA